MFCSSFASDKANCSLVIGNVNPGQHPGLALVNGRGSAAARYVRPRSDVSATANGARKMDINRLAKTNAVGAEIRWKIER